MITSGAIEALELTGMSLLDRGDTVVVEGPTYLGAIMAFRGFEAEIVTVPMDDEGLDVDANSKARSSVGSARSCCTRSPITRTRAGVEPHARAARTARRARAAHGFLVFEDVAYRELGFDDDAPPTLWSLAPDVVIQAGTTSKTFFPGVRLGWAAGAVRSSRRSLFPPSRTPTSARARSGSVSTRNTSVAAGSTSSSQSRASSTSASASGRWQRSSGSCRRRPAGRRRAAASSRG